MHSPGLHIYIWRWDVLVCMKSGNPDSGLVDSSPAMLQEGGLQHPQNSKALFLVLVLPYEFFGIIEMDRNLRKH